MRLWFGKHCGSEVEDCPSDYLGWLVSSTEPQVDKSQPKEEQRRQREQWQDLLSEAESELEARGEA